MKNFKDFVKDISDKKKESWLSWDGHHELRDMVKKKIPFLSWPGHETVRQKDIKEGYYKPEYDKEYHDHPDIKANNLTADHLEAIQHYTSTGGMKENGHRSSFTMNTHLRKKSGDTTVKPIVGHDPEKIENGIKQLSAAFTPENTNKTKTTLYSGIPSHIGETLKKAGHGSQHHIPGFTSTSSDPTTAIQFSRQYANKGDPKKKRHYHMIEYHAEPGTALSVAPFSNYDENESILHHGSKITYHGEKTHKDVMGNTIHTHVVTVHNEHKPLEEYGQ
jgi:hypothetical protein